MPHVSKQHFQKASVAPSALARRATVGFLQSSPPLK